MESINSSRKIVVENEVVEVQLMNGYTVVSNLNHKDTGYGYITSAAAEAKALNTTLFTLTFAVKDNAKAGLAAVSIDSDCVADAGASVEFAYVAGGVMVLDNTTGGSTTGGSTTGGSTTGGSTTGGSTTGGSTTGGSTTGGSTTGSSTTGGSTTGGSTTGGSTTGGSTTGGSTTGGSTTGGSMTDGSTT